jgi:hypothetical protein
MSNCPKLGPKLGVFISTLFFNFLGPGELSFKSYTACSFKYTLPITHLGVPIYTSDSWSFTSNATPTPMKLKKELCQGGPKPSYNYSCSSQSASHVWNSYT